MKDLDLWEDSGQMSLFNLIVNLRDGEKVYEVSVEICLMLNGMDGFCS